MQGMGMYGAVGIIVFILGLAKEIFIIALLFQGIRLANIFIKKNNNDKNPPWDVSVPPRNTDQDENNTIDQ